MNRSHASRVIAFQEIRRTVPLTAVLERYGVLGDLKRMGAQLYGACPIHNGSNKRQFVVNPNSSEWKCFSPEHDSGGGTLEFVAEKERVDIPHAARLVASWFAITGGNPVNQRTERRNRKMSEGQRPSHKVFVVEDRAEGDERDAFWTRVGSAWPHKDGKGLNLQLATGVAVSGRVVLREYTEEDAEVDKKAKKPKR